MCSVSPVKAARATWPATANGCASWSPLEPLQRQEVIEHLSQWDHPAERGAIEVLAAATGWHWRWAWQGSHGAEALALLTPAHQLARPLS